MSSSQLKDSWGDPADIHQTVLKTKTKEEWCYGRTGKNRYANRVYVEANEVIGWKN